MADVLFPVQNLFYLGAYQRAINEAQDLAGLSEVDSTTRDVLVHRSYIALGSAEVRLIRLHCMDEVYTVHLNRCIHEEWLVASDQ